jgi:hypothetical protein
MPVVSLQRAWVGGRFGKFSDAMRRYREGCDGSNSCLGGGFAAGSDQRRQIGPRMRRLKLRGQTTQKAIPASRRHELSTDRQTVRRGVGGKTDTWTTRYVGKAGEDGMCSGTGFLSVDLLRIWVRDRPRRAAAVGVRIAS